MSQNANYSKDKKCPEGYLTADLAVEAFLDNIGKKEGNGQKKRSYKADYDC